MQRHRDFHHTETRCQMTWIDGYFLHDILAQLLTELRQFFN